MQQVDASVQVLDKDQGSGELENQTSEKERELTREELLDKVSELKALAEKNYDLYLRAEAEMDNQKKRFRREKEELAKFAAEDIIKQLLPVMDNLQNAIGFCEKEGGASPLLEGIKLTLKMLSDVLSKAGLQEIKAMGEDFDPNLHQAVLNEETSEVKPGKILRELQKGYFLKERLLRPSMVVVSKSPSYNAGKN